MKFLFILSAVLLATAQDNFFGQGFTNIFQTLGQSIVHQLDTTGVQLLNASVTAGKTLISQGIQALALNNANALGKSSQDIQLPPMLQNVESSLHNVVDTLMGEMKNVFGYLVQGLQGVMDKLTKLAITPEEVISEVDKLVNNHKLFADAFLRSTRDKADEVISSLTKSRRNAFTDFFESLKPTIATTAGGAIKCGATNLLQKAKDSVAQLGQKLQPHIEDIGTQLGTLVMHGSNAMNALKQAGSDILQQILTNMTEPANKIAQTVVDAGQTVVGHIGGALLGTNTDPATTTVAPCT